MHSHQWIELLKFKSSQAKQTSRTFIRQPFGHNYFADPRVLYDRR